MAVELKEIEASCLMTCFYLNLSEALHSLTCFGTSGYLREV